MASVPTPVIVPGHWLPWSVGYARVDGRAGTAARLGVATFRRHWIAAAVPADLAVVRRASGGGAVWRYAAAVEAHWLPYAPPRAAPALLTLGAGLRAGAAPGPYAAVGVESRTYHRWLPMSFARVQAGAGLLQVQLGSYVFAPAG